MILLLMAMQADLVASAQGSHKIEIDGHAYRVKVRGETFSASRKSLVVMRTPERGDALRRAVVQATGCAIRDAYWEATDLRGTLDCPVRKAE